ncbi:ABC transporter permease [Actinophytocola sp.]|uniref:ABC transporter permease n=1 Tax=Actinophytocola sp. TaxID=1872138 RepID=UPI003D6A3BB5
MIPIGFFSLLTGAVLWEVTARAYDILFLPPLSAVLARLARMTADGQILSSLGNSLFNLAVGYILAAVVGIGVGLLMGSYRKVEAALDIYVYAFLTAPSLVFAPIFFSIFGLGRGPILGVIVMNAIFIVIINTADAVRSVPRPLVEMARSLCATDRQVTRRVIVPAAMPLIMTGLRVGMVRAVKGMVVGEMFIAIVGLGAVIRNAGRRLDVETSLAVLLVIIAVALLANALVSGLDRRVNGWLPSTARS